MLGKTIKFGHDHPLPDTAVRSVLEQLIGKLNADYGIDAQWRDEASLAVKHQFADGVLKVLPGRLEVDIKLGMMASMFEGKIRQTISDFCQEKLV